MRGMLARSAPARPWSITFRWQGSVTGACHPAGADRPVEEAALSGHHHHHDHDHTEPPSDLVLRVKALESLLVEKGLVDPAALDLLIDTYETKIGPRNGASVVARAWSDLAFKKWLLDDATA